ncbi:MAG: Zn-ribbon domain-containing protein [Halobacteriales archaeon]
MPHECTTCGRTFPDGSKEMLSGCPDCGGNKFQFHPSGNDPSSEPDDASTGTDVPDSDGVPDSDAGVPGDDGIIDGDTGIVDDGTDAVTGVVDDGSTGAVDDDTGAPPDPDPSFEFDSSPPGSPPESDDGVPPAEDRAQASARSTVVSEDELPRSDDDSSAEGTGPSGSPDDDSDSSESADPDRPDLSELRAELNDQFESIKIHDRGEYELNLMELYDREEHIVALQEDGRYVIDVPGSWRDDDGD